MHHDYCRKGTGAVGNVRVQREADPAIFSEFDIFAKLGVRTHRGKRETNCC